MKCTVIAFPDPPFVGAPRALEFRTNSIVVLIEWIQSRHHRYDTTYSVNAIPWDLVHNIITLTSSTSAQLQLSYNTNYNVSIIATLCGQRNATTIVSLYFGEYCGDFDVSILRVILLHS